MALFPSKKLPAQKTTVPKASSIWDKTAKKLAPKKDKPKLELKTVFNKVARVARYAKWALYGAGAVAFSYTATIYQIENDKSIIPPPVAMNHNVAQCDLKNYSPEHALTFTFGEKRLAQDIFGNRVDLSKIPKYFAGDKHSHNYAGDVCPKVEYVDGKWVTSVAAVEFFGTWMQTPDFSKADADRAGVFVHEIAHVDQFQNNSKAAPCKVYDYTLRPNSTFEQFCVEQQAAMVQDYYRHYLHPSRAAAQRLQNTDEEGYRILKRVVEAKYPQTKITRKRLEAQWALEGLKKAPPLPPAPPPKAK